MSDKKIKRITEYDDLDTANEYLESGWEFVGFYCKKVKIPGVENEWQEKPVYIIGHTGQPTC